VDRLVRRAAPEVPPEPPRLRDLSRVLILVGAAIVIVSAPLPWLVRVGNPPPQTVSGWSGVADGFFQSVVAAVLAVLAWSRAADSSNATVIRALPAILGSIAVAFGIGALRAMENQQRIWEREGATGVEQPALWIFLVGAAVLAFGGIWLGIRWLRDPARPRPTIGVPRHHLRWAAFGTGGAVLGGAIVAVLVLNSGLGPVAMSLPLVVGVLLGALVGGNLGARLARRGATAPPASHTSRPLDRVGGSVRRRAPSERDAG
jgi:hypothetical protein